MLRSISESLKLIKKDDADTAVTIYLIRQLAKTGKIKSITSGKKYLINMQSLKEYLGLIPSNKGEF